MYVITATATVATENGTISNQVPTFLLDERIQGIVGPEHAKQVALSVLSAGLHSAEHTEFSIVASHIANVRTEVVKGDSLLAGHVLVGDNQGRSRIGEIDTSSAMPGLLRLETEHGPLYLDPDEEYEILREDN